MKKVLIVIAVIILLLILAFYTLTGAVNHTPYIKEAYYSLTLARLDSIQKKSVPTFGTLQAGFARVNITPRINAAEDDPQHGVFKIMPLAGYGDREGKPAQGIHDSLFIKAIALNVNNQVIIMLGSDLLIMPPEVTDSLEAQLTSKTDLKRSQLFLSATHTHSSLGAWARGFVGSEFAGEENPGVRRWLTDRIMQCILQARADLKPARIASAYFSAPANVKNRLVGKHGKVNDVFTFLVIEQAEGKRGVIGAYAAHATTLAASNLLFSGDYPGFWQRKLERDGMTTALFFAGTVGSHGPVGDGSGFERAQNIGEALADSVKKYMNSLSWQNEIGFRSLSCRVRLPEFHFRVSMERHLCSVLSRQLLDLPDDIWIQAVRIGDLVWVTTPCDFSGEFAIDVQNHLYQKGYKSVISSFNGGYVGYVIPRKYFYLEKYESFTMAWFGPNLGDYFVDLIYRLTDAVVQ
jgi:hypothetical protein